MDLGISLRDFVLRKRRESLIEKEEEEVDTPDVCTGEILHGRRKSIFQVAGAIRTGVRLGSITRETAYRSKLGVIF